MDYIDSRTGYLRIAWDNPKDIALRALDVLCDVDFDTMIGTGLSGGLIVPVLAREFGVHWGVVRKDNDGSHTDTLLEGTVGKRWIFVDDFIDSGATEVRVINKVRAVVRWYSDFNSHYVGAYLYDNNFFLGRMEKM